MPTPPELNEGIDSPSPFPHPPTEVKAKLADVTACLEEFLTHNYKGQSDGLERVEKCGGELPEAIKKAAKGGVKYEFAT